MAATQSTENSTSDPYDYYDGDDDFEDDGDVIMGANSTATTKKKKKNKNNKSTTKKNTPKKQFKSSMTFDTLTVTDNTTIHQNIGVDFEQKEIWFGGKFKVRWKNVQSFRIIDHENEDLDFDDYHHNRGSSSSSFSHQRSRSTSSTSSYSSRGRHHRHRLISRRHDHDEDRPRWTLIVEDDGSFLKNGMVRTFTATISSSSSSVNNEEDDRVWNTFATKTQQFWNDIVSQRKEQQRKQQQEEQEEKKRQRQAAAAGGGGGASYGRKQPRQRQMKLGEKFLANNESNIEYNAQAEYNEKEHAEIVEENEADHDENNTSRQLGSTNAAVMSSKKTQEKFDEMMSNEQLFKSGSGGDGGMIVNEQQPHHSDHDGGGFDDDFDKDHVGGDHNPSPDDDDDEEQEFDTVNFDQDPQDDIDNDQASSEQDTSFKSSSKKKRGANASMTSRDSQKKRKLTRLSKTTDKDDKKKQQKKKKDQDIVVDDDDEQSSDDDFMFDGPSLTTPSSQRVVSPGTSIRRRKRALDDEEEEVDEADDDQTTSKSGTSKKTTATRTKTKTTTRRKKKTTSSSNTTRGLPGVEEEKGDGDDDDDESVDQAVDNTPSITTFFQVVEKPPKVTSSVGVVSSKSTTTKQPCQNQNKKTTTTVPTEKATAVTKRDAKKNQKKKKSDDVLDNDSDTTVDGDDDVTFNLLSNQKSRPIQDFFTPTNTKTHHHHPKSSQTKDDDETLDESPSEVATVVPGSTTTTVSRPGAARYTKSTTTSAELDDDQIDEYNSSQSVKGTPPQRHRQLQLTSTTRRSLNSGGGRYSRSVRKRAPNRSSFAADHALAFADGIRSPVQSVVQPMKKFRTPTRTPSKSRSLSPIRSPKQLTPTKQLWRESPNARGTTNPFTDQLSSNQNDIQIKKWRGLANIGNSCYLNSSLQMLFSLPEFMEKLYSFYDDDKATHLIRKLRGKYNAINKKEKVNDFLSARSVKEAIDKLTTQFHGSDQRDAHEFLSDLIDRIHEQDMAPSNDEQDDPANPTQESSLSSTAMTRRVEPADEFFRLDVEVTLKCLHCGYSRCKQEMYRNLSLDIDPSDEARRAGDDQPSIQHSLDRFFGKEIREIKCEKCKVGELAEQTMRIRSAPKALVLHLKRFVVETTTAANHSNNENQPNGNVGEELFHVRKRKDKVILNETISLSKYFQKTEKDNSSTGEDGLEAATPSNDPSSSSPLSSNALTKPYDIRAVVHHIGKTADSGHYTADALRWNDETNQDQWVSYNDGITEEISVSDAIDDPRKRMRAYMVLYSIQD